MNKNLVTIHDVDIKHETDNAVLIECDGEEYWIPFSQVEEMTKGANGRESSITITQWIADQKGLS